MSDDVRTQDELSEQTADNLIQINPPDDAELTQRRKKRVISILLLAAAVLVVVAVLLFVLFPEVFDFYVIRRYFHYMGKRDQEGYGLISFESAATNDYAVLGDGLVLGTEGGLYYYDLDGTQKMTVQATVAAPHLLKNADTALCYGMGSSYISLVNESGERLLDQTLSGILLDADLSTDGYLCYNLTEDGYKTVATVLNRSQEPIYLYRSSSQYLSACAVSENGAYLAVAGLTEEDGMYTTTLSLLKTDEEIVAGTDQGQSAKRRISIGNQFVYDMIFLSKDRLCVLGQDSMLFVDTDSNLVSEYEFGTSYLRGYAFSDRGFAAVLLGQSMTGDRYTLVTLDKNGEVLGTQELDRNVRSVDAAGGFVCVLTEGELLVYSGRLRDYAASEDVETATQALMREDGTVLLISNGSAKLFIP